jgi:hypothetical protein
MKLFRYRKPSLRTLSGYTRVKRRAKRSIGLSQFQAVTRPSRIKQKIKYEVGLYSKPVRVVRNTSKGIFPSLMGFFRFKK